MKRIRNEEKHTQGKQEEDEETKDQPSVVRSEDALATLADLVCRLGSLSGGIDSLGDSRDSAVRLFNALSDEVVLEGLVEHGDGDGDRVSQRGKQLEP